MAPVTLAARRFAAEFEAFWAPPPGHEAKGPPVLRLVVDPVDRKDMRKALRVMEWQPENRRAFVVVESAFVTEAAFALAVATALEADYDKLREGLAEDGMAISALAPAERPVTTERLAALLRRAAEHVIQVLDGLVLAIVPARLAEGGDYASFVARLAAASNGASVRVCVLDHPSLRSTLPGQARFAVDHDALHAFLKELRPDRASGPDSAAPQLTPPQKAALEKELGRRVTSRPTGDELRTLLLDAGKTMSDGQLKTAVRKFRAARMLCHLSGLTQEEAATSLALGSVALAAGDKHAAIAAYRAAKQIAIAGGIERMAAQAELGIAGAHGSTRDYRDARASYAEVVNLAASIPALRLEAMRMTAECFVLEEQPAQAIASYGEVLDAAERLEPGVRRTTSFAHAGKAFAKLLLSLGQPKSARDVEERVARLEADGDASGSVEVPL
jgi:tetratricopeptide (TPR) repeat protein